MALTKLLIALVVLVVGAQARFGWDNNAFASSFANIRMPKLEMPKFPDFPEMKPLKFKPMEPIVFPDFPEMKPMKPFKMPEFKPIEPIDPDFIRTHVPGDGESFTGSVVSSHFSSRTVNGKTVSEGGSGIIVNDNGKADEEHISYQEGDKDLLI